MEMNNCRRCGATFSTSSDHAFTCKNGHTIYANASPTVGLILENSLGEIVVLKRAIDPGKGMYDLPGGFCDGAEPLEDAIAREIAEELGIEPSAYSVPVYICSGIDPYDFAGEEVTALCSVFVARLYDDNTTLHPADDAASAQFITADKELASKLFFPALRAGLRQHLSA